MKMNSRGFTLIELLVVIAIIGILAGIVIVSLTSAQDRAQRTSALATMKSIMPELVTCSSDGGPTGGYANNSALSGVICYGRAGYSVTWPTLGNSWAFTNYLTASGTIAASTFQYAATKTGQATILCSMSTNTCQ